MCCSSAETAGGRPEDLAHRTMRGVFAMSVHPALCASTSIRHTISSCMPTENCSKTLNFGRKFRESCHTHKLRHAEFAEAFEMSSRQNPSILSRNFFFRTIMTKNESAPAWPPSRPISLYVPLEPSALESKVFRCQGLWRCSRLHLLHKDEISTEVPGLQLDTWKRLGFRYKIARHGRCEPASSTSQY
jgi:hypothetical protein